MFNFTAPCSERSKAETNSARVAHICWISRLQSLRSSRLAWEAKKFIGERAQLNGMGLRIPLFWVCLSEAYYTVYVYIYVAIFSESVTCVVWQLDLKDVKFITNVEKIHNLALQHWLPFCTRDYWKPLQRASSHSPLSISGSESCGVFSILWEEFCNCDLTRAGFNLSWGQVSQLYFSWWKLHSKRF